LSPISARKNTTAVVTNGPQAGSLASSTELSGTRPRTR
jgi:hypothetical protein